MKYDDMIQTFLKNGIDIKKYAYDYGKLPTHPGDGNNFKDIVYLYETIGTTDNGKVNKIYDTEEAMVEDVTITILRHALNKRKACYQKNQEESWHNKKIRNIAYFCYVQITGYKGFSVTKAYDRESGHEYWRAIQVTPNGLGIEFNSSKWDAAAKDAQEQEQKELELLRAKLYN